MVVQSRSHGGALALMIVASAAVSVCTGAETLAAERLLRHSGAALAVTTRTGGNPLAAWLSQVTHDVASRWHGSETVPTRIVSALHVGGIASGPRHEAPRSRVVAAARVGGATPTRLDLIDLPPPGR